MSSEGKADSLGQDAVALGLGEVLQLQGVLSEESHGQVEIVVPKLQRKHGDECQAGGAGSTEGQAGSPPRPPQGTGSPSSPAARSCCCSGTSVSASWQTG